MLELASDDAIDETQEVTIAYTKPSSDALKDAAGNEVASFGDIEVANSSTVDGTPPTLESAEVEPGVPEGYHSRFRAKTLDLPSTVEFLPARREQSAFTVTDRTPRASSK